MSAQLERDVVFGALTRPQMFAGVTYSFFVLNGVVTAELFLINVRLRVEIGADSAIGGLLESDLINYFGLRVAVYAH